MNREAAQILSQNESQGNQNVLVEQNEPEQLINGIERVEQRNDEVLDKNSEQRVRVVCPDCNGEFKGNRGLNMHLSRSSTCGGSNRPGRDVNDSDKLE